VHFSPVPNFRSYFAPLSSKYQAVAVYDVIQHCFHYMFKNMRYGKLSFIITILVMSVHVHFSDISATFGLATPTKHGCPFQYPYRALTMTPIVLKIHVFFPYLGIITART